MFNLTSIKYRTIIFACWYVMLASICMDYFSKTYFTLELSTILGLVLIFRTKRFVFKRSDLWRIGGMLVILLGMVVNRLFFKLHLSYFVNFSFIFKMSVFFLFVYFFITRYGFPFKSIFVFACAVLPHFLGLLIGMDVYYNGQFSGFHGDPNYLSPDLLASFGAGIILINHKSVKGVTWLFFTGLTALSFFLILSTVSRTATLASIVILAFFIGKYALTKSQSFITKALVFMGVVLIFGSYFYDQFVENPLIGNLYERFFESEKGGDLVENERYKVWGLSYYVIQETGLFQGYGVEQFLEKKYKFLSHNAWLDIGITTGAYTFWSFTLTSVIGLLAWFYRYAKNMRRIEVFSVESFLLIFSFSLSFMMFSISVSYMYYFWFIIYLIYIKLVLPLPQMKVVTIRRIPVKKTINPIPSP